MPYSCKHCPAWLQAPARLLIAAQSSPILIPNGTTYNLHHVEQNLYLHLLIPVLLIPMLLQVMSGLWALYEYERIDAGACVTKHGVDAHAMSEGSCTYTCALPSYLLACSIPWGQKAA